LFHLKGTINNSNWVGSDPIRIGFILLKRGYSKLNQATSFLFELVAKAALASNELRFAKRGAYDPLLAKS